jgi:DNA polymerase V
VIVLSNNDGCAVAVSSEVKTLGIKRGTPIFQVRDLIEQHHIVLFSSNYALYADVSDRTMTVLHTFSSQVEVVSIDEAFLSLAHIEPERLHAYGHQIRATVQHDVGIPVSVGIGETKTLSKIATEIVKKHAEYQGVLVLAFRSEDEMDIFLSLIAIEDVWGIGPRYARRLREQGITTARHLKYANTRWIRKHLTVVGERTVLELRGISCIPLDTRKKPKKGILSSKTFGKPIERLDELAEAVATYTVRAAEKLRSQGSVAGYISVFIHTNQFKRDEPQYANSASRTLLFPTSFTPDLIGAALKLLKGIYKPGYKYRKAGVYLSKITPKEHIQYDLFGDFSLWQHDKQRWLMEAVDHINRLWGHDTIFFGAQGIRREWQMRQMKRSPRYTTRWDELFAVT